MFFRGIISKSIRPGAATQFHRSATRTLKIYTKTGDKGKTSLYTGERVEKTNQVFYALGATDELSSALGLAREFASDVKNQKVIEIINNLQIELQDIGSAVATPKSSATERKLRLVEFSEEKVFALEALIDEFDSELPPLTTFILPGGGKCSSQLHVARSVCRRAERETLPLVESEETDRIIGRYLNRLSDLLFQMARYAQYFEGKEDRFK